MKHEQRHGLWKVAVPLLLGGLGLALLTMVCYRLHVNPTTVALLYLIVVVLVSLQGLLVPSALVAVMAFVCLDYFFTVPLSETGLSEWLDLLAPVTFLGTAWVVTRLMSKAQTSFQETRALRDELRLVVDTIPALVWSARPDGSRDFLSQRWLEYTGLSLEQGLGEGWAGTFHPDDRAGFLQAWHAHAASGQPFEREARVRRADGEYHWLLIRAVPLRDGRGTIVKWYGTSTDIDYRKRAEEALREQAALLDLTHDTVFVRDTNEVITYWNRGAEELYGWSMTEAVGKNSHDLNQTVFPVPFEDIMAELIRTGRWEGELIHKRRDGTKVVVASRWALQRDGSGHPVAILETNNDVTERRRAEEALRESEEKWRAVFENNPTMYFMVDAAGTVLSVNPFGAEQLGYTVDELVGRPVLDVFYEADREAVVKNVSACLESLGRAAGWEFRKVRKDGTVLWVRETARAMLIKGRPVLLVVCEDITEGKRAAEALRKTEQRLRTVVANTPIILFAVDRSGVYTLSEGQGLDPLGLKPGEVVGQSVFDVWHDVPQVLAAFRRALAGEAFTEVVEVNDVVFETHFMPFLDERGGLAGVNGVANNITERKRAEDALRKAQAELAHITRVTTLGELAASIAHEINQPLAAIIADAHACLHWLEADRPDLDSVREALAAVAKDGERAAEVITRIRSLLARASVAHRPCDLAGVIGDVLPLVRPELGRHGMILKMALAPDLPTVRGDRIQLQQVLLNLLVNAVEASKQVPPERRRLTLHSTVEYRDDGPWAVVGVEDCGVGFRESEAARLFEAFYTTKPGGLGMGLSISRSIIEGHGGRLWATANADHGATFHFALPGMR
jgi:PAS domain S-box-containing protein